MTYSFNSGTTYTEFLGTDANDFIIKIPNNTYEKIVPKDIRDGLYTIWDNISYKPIFSGLTGSTIQYNGVDGINILNRYESGGDGFKMLIGKPKYNGSYLFDDTILGYNPSDIAYQNADLIIYNNKPDDHGNNDTKVLLLAGDNTSLPFNEAPYIEIIAIDGATPSYRLNLVIPNQYSTINIDAPNMIIGSTTSTLNLLYDVATSTGILNKPSGGIGDLQINLDDCYFGSISGASASIGDILVMGATNTPYWASASSALVYSLTSVLQVGNETTGYDIILTDNDKAVFGNDSIYALNMYNSGTMSYIDGGTGSYLDINVNKLKLTLPGIGANRILFTDSNGFAEWRNVSIVASGTQGSIQINDGSNGFTHDNTLLYDTTNKSLKVNTSGLGNTYSYTLALNANTKGGLYLYGVESAVSTYALMSIIDTTTGANFLNVTNSSTDKTVYMGSNSLSNIGMFIDSWSTYANSDDNIFIRFRTGKNKMTLQSLGSTYSAILNFQTGGTKTPKAKVSINESGTGDDFNILSKAGNKNMRLGYYDGSTITSLVNLFTGTYSGASETGSVIILGNISPVVTVPDVLLTGTNRVLLGLNVTPKTTLDIHGTITNRLTLANLVTDGNNMFEYESSSIYVTDDVIAAFSGDGHLNRLDTFISLSSKIAAGATIKVMNQSTQIMEIAHIGLDVINGEYNTTTCNNIFFNSVYTLNETVPMQPGETYFFTAVNIGMNNIISGDIAILSNAENLVTEDIIWVYNYTTQD